MEHGWQGRYIEGYELANKYNLKFVFGAEAYWVKDRFEKDRSNCHIYIGAKNERGRQAINDILSEASITGYYAQPRIDVPLILSLPSDDVFVTTACVAYWKYEDVEEITLKFKEHFKHFFLEVQYHNTDLQRNLNRRIIELSKKHGIPLIMGTDSHYIKNGDNQERTDYLSSKGINYPDEDGWYLDYPDGDEAYRRFANQCVLSHDEILEAINNTNVFLSVEPYENPCFTKEIKMPTLYPALTQEQKNQKYSDLVWEKWDAEKHNVPQDRWSEYEEEIRKEIEIVHITHHADYFLLDYEIVKRGKEKGGVITSSGRGSGVSFYTNKLLGFTDVDRISARVKMYPERFMSPTRILETKSLADLDLNLGTVGIFAEAQSEVLGDEHSAPMLAYGTMKPKAAWKMYAKSQAVNFDLANKVSEQIEKYEWAVKHASEDEKEDIDVLEYIDAEYQDIYKQSKIYLGVVSDLKIHPCSYLLYQGNIRKEVGLTRCKDNICCIMDGKWAEEYKFLKNDLLKVSVVDLIDKIYKRIGIPRHSVRELLELCPPESNVWDIYKKGCTLGINQVEQVGTSARAQIYAPTNISELCAFVAAIRPGFKSMYKTFERREHFEYGIKALDDLIQTKEMPHSFILYQEMSMAVLNFAGIPMSECYEIIKNIAKKRVEKVLKYKTQFIEGFTKTLIEHEGQNAETAQAVSSGVWQILEDSSAYSFNACVTGSTQIRRAGCRGRFEPTVAEMYRIKNDREYAINTNHRHLHDKYRRYGYGNALSMYPDGRVRKNTIVDIHEVGERNVYEVVTESGASIVCTDNHKFPTPDGEQALCSLATGDFLYVVSGYEKNTDKFNFTDGNYQSNIPTKGQRGFQKIPSGASVIYLDARQKRVDSAMHCEVCGRAYDGTKRFELHHKDFDRTHNEENNFAWCCVSCHKKLHYAENRVKVFEKGLPIHTEKIISISQLGSEPVYDIEMAAPAHNFISCNGLVTSNSHSYSVAIDSLYGAFLKTNYPLQFYEVFLSLLQEKGEKDRLNEAKNEAESYFKINFPPYRYGQDNRTIVADFENNAINNSISAIKGFGSAVGDALYECGLQQHERFTDVLRWLNKHSVKTSTVEPLIKIDYFMQFGNTNELVQINEMFNFFKCGESKNISKEKVVDSPYLPIIERYSAGVNDKGKELKSYIVKDINSIIVGCEDFILSLGLKDMSYRQKASIHLDLLGYVDMTTGKEEDRRKLLITGIRPLPSKTGGFWGHAVFTKSIGSGKTSRLTLKDNLYVDEPIFKGDIIFARVVEKKKEWWYLTSYDKI